MAEATSTAKEEGLFPSARASVRDYTLLCVGALLALLVLLVGEDLSCWAVLVVFIGIGGLAARWTMAPPLLLCVVMLLLGVRRRFAPSPLGDVHETHFLMDLALAMSLMVYTAAHMRLLTLLKHAVPPDRRRVRAPQAKRVRGRWLLPPAQQARTAQTAGPGELARLLVAGAVFSWVAYLLWLRLAFEPVSGELRLPYQVWRVIVTVWVVFMMLLLAHLLLSYLRRALASPEESLLYLQDQLWAQTRGEQRSIWRWLTWARLRGQARGEGK